MGLRYQLCDVLGWGGSAMVWHAIETTSEVEVAVKKLRTSQKIKRPILQYEAKIMQLLQGNPSIPILYGYGHLPHFEYISMELLGPNLKEVCPQLSGIKLATVVEFTKQALSALQHVHSHGLVYRDIKIENFLCSRNDPSQIKLSDFGIAYPIQKGTPSQYDPVKEHRHIVGTHNWASLNSHDGLDLAPRDDLESLAYIILWLYYGDLPWRGGSIYEPFPQNIIRIRSFKAALNGTDTTEIPGFPSEFGEFLDYSRSLKFDQIPDYAYWLNKFTELGKNNGGENVAGQPLDWRAREDQIDKDSYPLITQTPSIPSYEGKEDDDSDDAESVTDSYSGIDGPEWEIQEDRDANLTLTPILPSEKGGLLDDNMPEIVEVSIRHHLPEKDRLTLKKEGDGA